MSERKRKRVVLAVILRQSKTRVRAHHWKRRVHLCRHVVHAIEMIPLRKIVIHPQSADVLRGITAQNGVEVPRNFSIGRINRCTESNFREISVYQCLDSGIEKSARNGDKFTTAAPASVVYRVGGNLLWGQGNSGRHGRFSRVIERRKISRVQQGMRNRGGRDLGRSNGIITL